MLICSPTGGKWRWGFYPEVSPQIHFVQSIFFFVFSCGAGNREAGRLADWGAWQVAHATQVQVAVCSGLLFGICC